MRSVKLIRATPDNSFNRSGISPKGIVNLDVIR